MWFYKFIIHKSQIVGWSFWFSFFDDILKHVTNKCYYYILSSEISGFIHWIKVISLHALIISKLISKLLLWRHVTYCMQCNETRKCDQLKNQCFDVEYWIYFTRDTGFLKIFSLVKIPKIQSHSWNIISNVKPFTI